MICTYNEVMSLYGSRHYIKEAINKKRLFKLEHNLYSNNQYVNPLQIITSKYPNAIFNSESAYYFYNLSDVIPTKSFVSIEKHKKIKSSFNVKITYTIKDLHELGRTTLMTHNTIINIYDRERLLIDLVRNKNKYSYDYYKEIVRNYRQLINELDINKLMDYLNHYKNKDNLLMIIQDEVF